MPIVYSFWIYCILHYMLLYYHWIYIEITLCFYYFAQLRVYLDNKRHMVNWLKLTWLLTDKVIRKCTLPFFLTNGVIFVKRNCVLMYLRQNVLNCAKNVVTFSFLRTTNRILLFCFNLSADILTHMIKLN